MAFEQTWDTFQKQAGTRQRNADPNQPMRDHGASPFPTERTINRPHVQPGANPYANEPARGGGFNAQMVMPDGYTSGGDRNRYGQPASQGFPTPGAPPPSSTPPAAQPAGYTPLPGPAIDDKGSASGSSELDRLRAQYQKYQTGGGQWQQYGVRTLQGMDLGGNNQHNDINTDDNVSTDAPGYVHPLVQEAIKRGIINEGDAQQATWEINNYGDLFYEPGKVRTFGDMAGQPGRATGITGPGPEHAGHPGSGVGVDPAPGSPSAPSAPAGPSGPSGPMGDNRYNQLYEMLLGRAQQGTDIDPNDPIIKRQTDAYNANEERSRRNYISDMAEQGGPLRNLQGEKRMAAERMGQRTGTFQAELMGRELTNRREEIATALDSMRDMLTNEQVLALERELGLLDNAIKQQGIDLGKGELDLKKDLGQQGLDLERLLGIRRLDDENDRFNAQLGFNTADRSSYWDAINRGLLK